MSFAGMFGMAQRRPDGTASIPFWQQAVWFGLAFFACAELSDFLRVRPGPYETFWLPVGLYVGALLLNEYRSWPGLVLAALLANFAFDLLHGTEFLLILFFFCSGTVEAMTAAWLVRRLVAGRPALATLREFVALLGLAAGLSALLGAIIGTIGLTVFGKSQSFGQTCLDWWADNAMAILLVTPLMLAWFSRPDPQRRRPNRPMKVLEAALLFTGLCALAWYVFFWGNGILSPRKTWLIPFLLWAGVRFGMRGATAANLLLALLCAFFTSHSSAARTPADLASGEYVLVFQTFLTVSAMVGLIPAIVLSERDRTLARLHESEERFRHLTQATFEGICISENGRILDVNDTFLAMFGYGREEVIGREILTLIAPAWRQMIAERIQSEQESLVEHELLRKDGSLIQAEARSKMIPWRGRTARVTALRDITEQTRAQRALRESEEKYARAFHNSPDAVTITRLVDGHIIETNEGFRRIFGHSPEAVIGRTTLELRLWANPADRGRALQELQQTGFVRNWELPFQTREGKTGVGLFSAEKIEIRGEPCLVTVVRDITERKQAEAALRASEESLRATIEHTPHVAVQWFDAQGRVTFWNRASEHLYGWAAAEAAGKTLAQLIFAPAEAALFASALKEIERTDKAIGPVEFPFHHRDGSPGTMLSTVFRIPGPTGELRFACMDVDLTQRKAAEAERAGAVLREQQARAEYTLQLIASQEAERTRIAGELHDSLGQNLLLIQNRAQLALAGKKVPAALREQLDGISQLASQSIAEARHIAHDLHPYQLDHLGLTRALQAMIDSAAGSSGIAIQRQLDDVDAIFPKDAAMNLYRVVQECLNNILKHSGASQAQVRLEHDVHEVQLQIEDDGRGFKVTEPVNGGKGMGLKNVVERVRILRGNIKVDSQPGHGTRIQVAIPIAEGG
jgi:PAS domain S-box-containing protein